MGRLRAGLKYLACLAVGGVGAVLVFLAIHLYQDHEALHALIQIEAARQRANLPGGQSGPGR